MNSSADSNAESTEQGRAPLRSIMSAPARCVTPQARLDSLSQLFLHGGISAAPVVDDQGKAIGVVSKTDILRQIEDGGHTQRSGSAGPALAEVTVADVMTQLVLCLEADAAISRAAALMAYEGVHRLIVTEADGKAVGVVSSLDILRWLAEQDGYVVAQPAHTQGE